MPINCELVNEVLETMVGREKLSYIDLLAVLSNVDLLAVLTHSLSDNEREALIDYLESSH